jgi:hypothetical protein
MGFRLLIILGFLFFYTNGYCASIPKPTRVTDFNQDGLVVVNESLENIYNWINDNVSDTAYGSTWDGVTSVAPSKNAIYDKIQALNFVSDLVYGLSWNGVTNLAPSQNAVYDKFESLSAGGDMSYSDSRFKVGNFSRDLSTATGTQAITGVGFQPKALILVGATEGTRASTWGFTDGTSKYYMGYQTDGTKMNPSTGGIGELGDGATHYNVISLSSFDSGGFTVTWTKAGSPTGTGNMGYIAFR